MPAPSTTNEFLDLVQKSGVLDEKKLDAYLDKLRAASLLPAKPTEMAGLLVRDALLTHFQADQILQGKWRRFNIGKYKVLERLGSGGMGSVYLCEHKLMRRRVAVKVLPTAKAEDPSSLERFYREARAVAALDHPNIVRAYDIDQDEKLHFLVMEYVDGASLQEIVKRSGAMDPLRVAHYIRQAAFGLQHAHESAGLVHRDIKPGNILVDRNGIVKVLDMGLARFFHDEDDIITKKYDENVLGTADYLAPEQALNSHEVDIRADIYSLGATCYYCLTGRTPFAEGTVAQKLIWHQTRQPKPILTLRTGVPPELIAIVDKMMAKDPNQRYQQPLAVADALSALTQLPIGLPTEDEMPRLSPAATGASVSSDSQLTPSGSSPTISTPGSGPRRSWQNAAAVVTPRPSSNPPAGPTIQPSPPSPGRDSRSSGHTPPRQQALTAPRLPMPVPARVTKPVTGTNGKVWTAAPVVETDADEEGVPWDKLDTATNHPGAKVDTAPNSRPRVPRPNRPAVVVARRQQSPWWLFVVIGIATLAILGLVISILVALGVFGKTTRDDSNDVKLNAAPEVLHVGKEEGAFHTLAAALRQVHINGRVIVDEPIIEESLYLDNHLPPPGVTIEAPAGKTLLWRAQENTNSAADTLLNINGVEGLHLRRITFDGRDKLDKLVILTGACPHLLLEDVKLQNFTKFGLLVMNCEGTSNRRIEFANLQINCKQAEAALAFDLNPKIREVPANRHIRLRNCRFEGQYKSPILVINRPFDDVVLDGKNVSVTAPGQPEVPLSLPK
jgi:serine/threonine protein kinase